MIVALYVRTTVMALLGTDSAAAAVVLYTFSMTTYMSTRLLIEEIMLSKVDSFTTCVSIDCLKLYTLQNYSHTEHETHEKRTSRYRETLMAKDSIHCNSFLFSMLPTKVDAMYSITPLIDLSSMETVASRVSRYTEIENEYIVACMNQEQHACIIIGI